MPKYPYALKKKAIGLFKTSEDKKLPDLAKELGISTNTLRNWTRELTKPKARRNGHSTGIGGGDMPDTVASLRAEIARYKKIIDLLIKADV